MDTVQNLDVLQQSDIARNNAIILQLEALDDDLTTLRQQYSSINALMGAPKFRNNFFPSRNYQSARVVYGTVDSTNFTFGNSFTFMGTADDAAINPEIIAGFFGPVRVSINTLITTTKDTSVSAQSRLRLISGGGNTAIAFSYALFRYVSHSVNLLVHLNPKFIADFPLLGATTLTKDNFIGSINLAPELLLKIYTSEKNMGFFANVRASTIWGTSQYLNNLTIAANSHHFNFGQINGGIFVSSSFQISVSAPIYASSKSLMRTPVLITTQIFPGSSSKK